MSGPTVQIHLNLGKSEAAQTSVRLRDPDGTWKVAAWADGIVLRDVTPVIDEEARRAIAAGHQNKRPMAFLQGEVIAWTGETNPNADPALAEALAPARVADMAALEGAVSFDAAKGRRIGFNPKKAARFYPIDAQDRAVERVDWVVARHWDFQAVGDSTRPMRPEEIVRDGAPTTQAERTTITRGRARTRDYLAAASGPAPPVGKTPTREARFVRA